MTTAMTDSAPDCSVGYRWRLGGTMTYQEMVEELFLPSELARFARLYGKERAVPVLQVIEDYFNENTEFSWHWALAPMHRLVRSQDHLGVELFMSLSHLHAQLCQGHYTLAEYLQARDNAIREYIGYLRQLIAAGLIE